MPDIPDKPVSLQLLQTTRLVSGELRPRPGPISAEERSRLQHRLHTLTRTVPLQQPVYDVPRTKNGKPIPV